MMRDLDQIREHEDGRESPRLVLLGLGGPGCRVRAVRYGRGDRP